VLNLDPAKLLVIAVVAVILLGPDRLPQVARQAGAAWRSFNEYRTRMETQVRDSIPDLPSSAEIARLARSPSALLNHLSSLSPDDAAAPAEPGADPGADPAATPAADPAAAPVAGVDSGGAANPGGAATSADPARDESSLNGATTAPPPQPEPTPTVHPDPAPDPDPITGPPPISLVDPTLN
jgi:sec-independent protein translocase protein TatB